MVVRTGQAGVCSRSVCRVRKAREPTINDKLAHGKVYEVGYGLKVGDVIELRKGIKSSIMTVTAIYQQ